MKRIHENAMGDTDDTLEEELAKMREVSDSEIYSDIFGHLFARIVLIIIGNASLACTYCGTLC